jgi:hypothetical protein
MFTTAGETRLIMGASVGTGVSPTAWGKAACTAGLAKVSEITQAATNRRAITSKCGMKTRILKR